MFQSHAARLLFHALTSLLPLPRRSHVRLVGWVPRLTHVSRRTPRVAQTFPNRVGLYFIINLGCRKNSRLAVALVRKTLLCRGKLTDCAVKIIIPPSTTVHRRRSLRRLGEQSRGRHVVRSAMRMGSRRIVGMNISLWRRHQPHAFHGFRQHGRRAVFVHINDDVHVHSACHLRKQWL